MLYRLVFWHFVSIALAGAANQSFPTKWLSIIAVTEKNFSSVFPVPFSTFGLEEALFPYSYALIPIHYSINSSDYGVLISYDYVDYGPSFLFTDACIQPGGASNCSAACSSEVSMFQDLKTLHNCMAYKDVAYHYAINNLTDDGRRVAESLEIKGDKANTTTIKIIDKIKKRFIEYCSSNVAGCKAQYHDWYQGSTQPPHPGPYFNETLWDFESDGSRLIESICMSVPSTVNQDIGGIGVSFCFS